MLLERFSKAILSFAVIFSLSTAQDDFSDDIASESNQKISISGKITDAETGAPIPGANVFIQDSDIGSASDSDGNFSIDDIISGSEITVSVIGYEDMTLFADSEILDFAMTVSAVEMSQLEVLASRADDKTAVAYSDVSKDELALRLGSQDIPLALNLVPSVYSTNQGGGAGDARINVRGFNQEMFRL